MVIQSDSVERVVERKLSSMPDRYDYSLGRCWRLSLQTGVLSPLETGSFCVYIPKTLFRRAPESSGE